MDKRMVLNHDRAISQGSIPHQPAGDKDAGNVLLRPDHSNNDVNRMTAGEYHEAKSLTQKSAT
jgi:hypothetical protein